MTAVSEFGFLHALRILCLGAGCFAASMSTAREGGQITITMGGERLELPLNPGHSDWTGSQGFAKVSILTRPADLETWQRFQSLRLAFDLLRSGVQTPEISILRRGDDAGFERWYGRADRGGLMVNVTDRSIDGTLLQVSGTFTGTLGQSHDFGGTIDLSAPMPVSGTFDVKLLPVR